MITLSPGDWQAWAIVLTLALGPPVSLIGSIYIWRIWRVWQPCVLLILYGLIAALFAWQYGRVAVGLPPQASETAELRPALLLFSVVQLFFMAGFAFTFNQVGTAVKQANEERERTEQLHHDWSRIMSHEIYTPLTIIHGYISMLKEKEIPPHLGEEIDGMGRGLNRLLVTARLFDAANQRLGVSLFDVQTMIETVIADPLLWTATRHRAGDVTITFERPYPKLIIQSDKQKLEAVVFEFLRNALKVSNHDSVVRVTLSDENGAISISVIDHDGGIAKENRERIWEPGVQLYEDMSSRPLEGSGSGLPAVARIAALLNGQAYLEQSALSIGSVFTVKVPKRLV